MECLFCNSNANEQEISSREFVETCPICGKYVITSSDRNEVRRIFDQNDEFRGKQYLYSSYLAELNEDGKYYFNVTKESITLAYRSRIIPINIKDKLDKIIERIYKKSTYLFENIHWDIDDYNKQYAKNELEYQNMIKALIDLKYLEDGRDSNSIYLTLKGIEYIENKRIEKGESKKCFVAMWFDEKMIEVFNNTISNTVKDSGYDAIIIPMIEHNDNINDHIVAEIKKAKFIIADFTGNRGGVYFEAGLALGLGKPVIWTCKEDYFNKTIKNTRSLRTTKGNEVECEIEDKVEIHFDVNHFNFIVWKDKDDLAKRLKDRIEATI